MTVMDSVIDLSAVGLALVPLSQELPRYGRSSRELRSGQLVNIAERSGREQDKAGGDILEELRRDGYM